MRKWCRLQTAFFHILSRRKIITLLVGIGLLVLLWNEWICWVWCEIVWNIPNSNNNPIDEVRFLIVADAQLIGYEEEKLPFGCITRWDSDRYLKKGFSYSLRASNANVVVFLGDLLDEGVHVRQKDFERSIARFNDIFAVADRVQTIYIPGDNDVGGEFEMVMPYLVGRFANSFVNSFDPSSIGLSEFSFVHVNAFNRAVKMLWNGTSSLCIVLSHHPLLQFRGLFQQIRHEVNPALILSGHSHFANFYEENWDSVKRYKRIPVQGTETISRTVDEHGKVIEFQTASCNYRMGANKMAYGLLSITRNRTARQPSFNVHYKSLWLPNRFRQLFIYFAVFFVLVFYLLKDVLVK